GEGKFVPASDDVLARLRDGGQVALRYVDEQGQPGGYPVNPNGSIDDVAAICDASGRVMGLMPHPERFVENTHHPQWTRRRLRRADGRIFFERAKAFLDSA
ncbi:MAG: phosphoribosylformylglycinamidine synthase subunit PurQ, partial [Planctomycetota bacterium]